jgi:hypothetical protein
MATRLENRDGHFHTLALSLVPQVRVSLDAFQKGELPNVCVVSGAIARENFLVAAASPAGPVAGGVPMTQASVQSLRKLQRTTLAMFLLSVVVTSVGLAGRSALWMGLGLALLGSAVGCLVLTSSRSVRAKVDGNEVVLQHVHEQFASAITSPKKKCDDCTGAGSCSVSEMETCETR